MLFRHLALLFSLFFFTACSSTYYSAMEKVGYHKRDIMVDRVESSQSAQLEAQEEFRSALEKFSMVVAQGDSDLRKRYQALESEYDDIAQAAERVSARIEKVEVVADDLFVEWNEELAQYKSSSLRSKSSRKLQQTKARYRSMLASMHKAEASMQPILATFADNVLFLKHNLNAQAIGSLKGEFASLEVEVDQLIAEMNRAIASSDAFIRELK